MWTYVLQLTLEQLPDATTTTQASPITTSAPTVTVTSITS